MTLAAPASPTRSPLPRKGQLFRRRTDGFVFRVESASRAVPGAHLQCVDATRIFGWFDDARIGSDFDRVDARRWLVCTGGLASAASAKILSRHHTWEAAHKAAGKRRDTGAFVDAYVEHADTYEAHLRGGTEAVQALAGQVRS